MRTLIAALDECCCNFLGFFPSTRHAAYAAMLVCPSIKCNTYIYAMRMDVSIWVSRYRSISLRACCCALLSQGSCMQDNPISRQFRPHNRSNDPIKLQTLHPLHAPIAPIKPPVSKVENNKSKTKESTPSKHAGDTKRILISIVHKAAQQLIHGETKNVQHASSRHTHRRLSPRIKRKPTAKFKTKVQ